MFKVNIIVDFSHMRRHVTVVNGLLGSEALQVVECIGLDHTLLVMVIDMEAGMMTDMVMEEKKNMATGKMIGIVVKVIVMAGIMRIAIVEMVIGMKNTGEEVQALMTTNMAREVGVLIWTVIMMTMANIHLGMLL